jgi:aryl-alcohol dehydrogenase-like predicted oxidoreductase
MLALEQGAIMDTRTIGSLDVSVVGVGCNNFGARLDQDGTNAVVHAALDAGINFFDTADIYGATQSEVFLGKALGTRRDEVVVATKFGMPIDDTHFGAKPAYVKAACEDSLRRLGTDRIDLYQLHYPDEATPIADTLGALAQLVDEGKVRAIGCSNLTSNQLVEAKDSAGEHPAFVSVQNQYSLLAKDPERDGVLDTCSKLDIGFLPFYPLANGLLTGKIRPGAPLPKDTRLAAMTSERSAHWLSDEIQQRVATLLDYAESIDVPILTLAFSWLLSRPQVRSVIAGASNPQQVHANASAVIELHDAVIAKLDELTA